MYSAASGWLVTDLNPDPFIVSMVQAATTLPIFLFALPAGALADIVDRRKFLIVVEVLYTTVAAIFAAIVWIGAATPGNLLLFTFLMGVGAALTAPVWQSIVPQLVPRQDLSPAVAANSVGVNVSRAVGPALGGVMVARMGIAAPFWFNAVSNLAVVGALLWWHPPENGTRLPVERFGSAIRIGFRHARNNPHLRATLIRAAAFFLFASAYWALLPLVVRTQIAGGPDLDGYLLGAIGAGAVGAAFALPWLKARLGPDRLVALGTFGTAFAMAGLDLMPSMHWPAPIVASEIEHDRGPVLVTIEYRIDPKDREPFLAALKKLARERRRDGAYAWGVFEDSADLSRMVETFLVESWLEHLRQHERVTNADRVLQDTVHRFQIEGAPKITHLIAAEPGLAVAEAKST